MRKLKITSESVTEGHPDKLCDQISDRILDAYLKEDPYALVAVECMISNHLLVIAGEVKSTAVISVEDVARKVLLEVGYRTSEIGIDGANCLIFKNIHEQSSDIHQGVVKRGARDDVGAGDQGMMYGFACTETEELMPLSISLAHKLAKQLEAVRKKGNMLYLLPDGKAQVAVEYDENFQPLRIDEVVVSTQHKAGVNLDVLRESVEKYVIHPVLEGHLRDENTRIYVNPIGRFVLGGPFADTGLTGRKIIVDTYGGVIPHGGGAFSGKDGTKVDRSGAYMARYVAKNIVAAGLATRCQVALSYVIGSREPSAVVIDTFGTEKMEVNLLHAIVRKVFDFSPKEIINTLDLRQPLFSQTSVYGHFKDDGDLPWERADKAELLSELAHLVHKGVMST